MVHGRGWPHVRYGKATCAVKNEDVCFLKQDITANGPGPRFSFYCICDGHNGPAAARFVEQTLISEVTDRLPTMQFPQTFQTAEGKNFAAKVNEAIIDAFAAIDNIWRTQHIVSGTTVTIAVVVGWLLTVANIGDSLAFLRTAGNVYPMTANHRLACNATEVDRLKSAGVQVARVSEGLDGPAEDENMGFGPLRAWPGGLAVGRSLGDIDARPEVVCRPHIKQVIVPAEMGARLVLASDGLWDALTPKKVMSIVKTPSVDQASTKLVATARSSGGGVLPDDVSVLVLDIVPGSMMDVPAPKHVKKNAAWKCCASTTDDDKKKLEFISDIDSLHWYPLTMPSTTDRGGLGRDPLNLTVHLGQSYQEDEQQSQRVATHHSTACAMADHASTAGRRRSASVGVSCRDSDRGVLEKEPHNLTVRLGHSYHEDEQKSHRAGAHHSSASALAEHACTSGKRRSASVGVSYREAVSPASVGIGYLEAVGPASPFGSAKTPRGSSMGLPRCDSAADVQEGSPKPRERIRKAAGMVEYTSRHFGPRRLDSAHIGST